MDRIELIHRRMRNKEKKDVTVQCFTIFEVTSKELDEKWGVSDFSRRKKHKDKMKQEPAICANLTINLIIEKLLELWQNTCNTDADIVIKFEEGLGKSAPSKPLIKTYIPNAPKPWIEYSRVEIPKDDIAANISNPEKIFKHIIDIMEYHKNHANSKVIKEFLVAHQGADDAEKLILGLN